MKTLLDASSLPPPHLLHLECKHPEIIRAVVGELRVRPGGLGGVQDWQGLPPIPSILRSEQPTRTAIPMVQVIS